MMIPDTQVLMCPNSPRYSAGASGLGSQVSCCGGPPRIHRMMTEFFRFGAALPASARSNRGSVSPAIVASAPACKKPRRDTPSERWKSGQPILSLRVLIAAHASMIEKKFLRVHQRPDDVLIALPPIGRLRLPILAVHLPRQIVQPQRKLLRLRIPRKRQQVKLPNLLRVIPIL